MTSVKKTVNQASENRIRKILSLLGWLTAFLYGMGLFWELFLGKYRLHALAGHRANLIPFQTIFNYILNRDHFSLNILVINLLGNICVFVPMGFLLPCLVKRVRRFRIILLIGTLLILVVESLQWLLEVGIFDVDDIILNVFGILVGYGCFQLLKAVLFRIRGDA